MLKVARKKYGFGQRASSIKIVSGFVMRKDVICLVIFPYIYYIFIFTIFCVDLNMTRASYPCTGFQLNNAERLLLEDK